MERAVAERILGLEGQAYVASDVRSAAAERLRGVHPDTAVTADFTGLSVADVKEAREALLTALAYPHLPENRCSACNGEGISQVGFSVLACVECSGRGWR